MIHTLHDIVFMICLLLCIVCVVTGDPSGFLLFLSLFLPLMSLFGVIFFSSENDIILKKREDERAEIVEEGNAVENESTYEDSFSYHEDGGSNDGRHITRDYDGDNDGIKCNINHTNSNVSGEEEYERNESRKVNVVVTEYYSANDEDYVQNDPNNSNITTENSNENKNDRESGRVDDYVRGEDTPLLWKNDEGNDEYGTFSAVLVFVYVIYDSDDKNYSNNIYECTCCMRMVM